MGSQQLAKSQPNKRHFDEQRLAERQLAKTIVYWPVGTWAGIINQNMGFHFVMLYTYTTLVRHIRTYKSFLALFLLPRLQCLY